MTAIALAAVCAAWGIGKFAFTDEPGILNIDLFEEPDWERLAKLAAEPLDVKSWQAWARERGSLKNLDGIQP
jgi:hypothetical protein